MRAKRTKRRTADSGIGLREESGVRAEGRRGEEWERAKVERGRRGKRIRRAECEEEGNRIEERGKQILKRDIKR